MIGPTTLPAGKVAASALPTIGLFDSGLGGLSVMMAVRSLLPYHGLIYFADARHFPYGGRPTAELIDRAAAATGVLVRRGASTVVVACNTASTAALTVLRQRFDLPVVGIEPALKPAGLRTRVGRIALLATEGTVRAPAVRELIERRCSGVDVTLLPAPGLAECVEKGDLDGVETTRLLRRHLAPARQQGADVLVLGCTHYAFLRSAIERVLGPVVSVIEPSEAIARQVARVVGDGADPAAEREGGRIQYLTSGDPARLLRALERLRSAGFGLPEGTIEREGDACDLL